MDNNTNNEEQQKYLNMMPDYSYTNPYEYRVGFGRRLGAYLLDAVIFTLLFMILLLVTGDIKELMAISANAFDMDKINEAAEMIAPKVLLLSLIYYSLEAFIGATLGKLTLGIKIGTEDRRHAGLAQLITRFAIKNISTLLGLINLLVLLSFLDFISSLLSWIVIIGCFFVLGQKRQSFHDMIAKTAVYYKDEIINN